MSLFCPSKTWFLLSIYLSIILSRKIFYFRPYGIIKKVNWNRNNTHFSKVNLGWNVRLTNGGGSIAEARLQMLDLRGSRSSSHVCSFFWIAFSNSCLMTGLVSSGFIKGFYFQSPIKCLKTFFYEWVLSIDCYMSCCPHCSLQAKGLLPYSSMNVYVLLQPFPWIRNAEFWLLSGARRAWPLWTKVRQNFDSCIQHITSCVNLGKSFNLSYPSFFFFKNGNKDIYLEKS